MDPRVFGLFGGFDELSGRLAGEVHGRAEGWPRDGGHHELPLFDRFERIGSRQQGADETDTRFIMPGERLVRQPRLTV